MAHPKQAGPGQETELKLFVDDGAALDAVARASGGAMRAPVLQKNNFYDTEARALRGKKMALRLRDEDGRFFVTLKGGSKGSAVAGLSSRAEEEVEIDAAAARRILEDGRSPLEAFGPTPPALAVEAAALIGGAPLVHLGSFENQRTRVDVRMAEADVVLELDRTSFPGGVTHYEVELEVPPGVDAGKLGEALDGLLAKAGVRGRPANGKAARFFAIVSGKDAP
jgi:uncharacterized protein YjbK